jgi:hypothetical protein
LGISDLSNTLQSTLRGIVTRKSSCVGMEGRASVPGPRLLGTSAAPGWGGGTGPRARSLRAEASNDFHETPQHPASAISAGGAGARDAKRMRSEAANRGPRAPRWRCPTRAG